MKEKNKTLIKRLLTIIKFAVLIFIIIGIPLIIYLNNPEVIDNFKSLESVNKMLDEYETSSIFVYIGIQIFQIVVSIIPGQAIQFAAGYAFNFWLAYLFSIIGIALGTFITFYLAKFLGTDFIHMLFGEERIQRHIDRFKNKRAFLVLFILFLIPGIPKDMLTYAAGVSDIRFMPFLIINLTARTPALMCTILIGTFFRSHSYVGMYVLIAIAIVLFILGVIFRDKLFSSLDRFYIKNSLIK
jgi:uncharacterized membrane protein YdjX (TVP38/TMEM64 family)